MSALTPADAATIVLAPISARQAMLFKDVRLRALRDIPTAFSSTYAKESQLSDGDWLARAEQWNNDKSAGYLAMDAAIPCGIAGGFIDNDDSARAYLVSMWVASPYRRAGVGRALVDAIVSWAAARRASTLFLNVTSNNAGAIDFYRHLGFHMTGHTGHYANDPALFDLEMARSIF